MTTASTPPAHSRQPSTQPDDDDVFDTLYDAPFRAGDRPTVLDLSRQWLDDWAINFKFDVDGRSGNWVRKTIFNGNRYWNPIPTEEVRASIVHMLIEFNNRGCRVRVTPGMVSQVERLARSLRQKGCRE